MQQQPGGASGPTIEQGRSALASTTFDPTLRQLQAELFHKEQAAIVADRALSTAAIATAALRAQVAELEGQVEALTVQLELLRARLCDHEGPRVVDLAGPPAVP